MIRLILLALGFLLTISPVSSQAGLTIKNGVLTVGAVPRTPPLLFMVNDTYTGLEADYARLIANKLKLEVEFISLEESNVIDAIETNQVDLIMGGLKVSPRLSNRVHLLPSYLDSSQMAIILYTNIIKLGGPGKLYRADKTIGVIKNSSGEILAKNEITDGRIKSFHDLEGAITALRKKNIDYLIHDATTSWHLARDLNYKDLQSLYKPLNTEKLTFGVNKDNRLLIQKLRRLFREWKDHGIIDVMNRRWIKAKMEVK